MIVKQGVNIFEQISDMLKAYYPVLYLNTYEYDRTKQKLRGILKNEKQPFDYYYWNAVDGMVKHHLEDSTLKEIENLEEPEELLNHIQENIDNNKNEVFILEDFHEFIDEVNIKIRLRQLAERTKVL